MIVIKTYFSFFVSPTYDFIMDLRKFGSKLEVLEPAPPFSLFFFGYFLLSPFFLVKFS